MRTDYDTAMIIFLWFFSVPLCIAITYCVGRIALMVKKNRVYTILMCGIVVYLMVSSFLMGTYTPRVTNRYNTEDVVVGSDKRSLGHELYASGVWLREYAGSEKRVVGSVDEFEIFSGFFGFEMHLYPITLKHMYTGDEQEIRKMITNRRLEWGSYGHTRFFGTPEYVLINNAFFTYPSFLFKESADPSVKSVLDRIEHLDNVYENDECEIYKVTAQ